MKETDITRKILVYLKSKPRCLAFKHHGGMYSNAGISDIIGVFEGESFFIEVKMPGKKDNLTELQRLFLKKANECGANAFVATCLEEVKQGLGIL